MKRNKISPHLAIELRNIKLPNDKWRVIGIEISFKRIGNGTFDDYMTVVYDDMNNTFYVKGDKNIIYPDDREKINEAIQIMDEANKIIRNNL